MHSAALKFLLPIFSAATLLLLAPAILHAQQQTALAPDIYPTMASAPTANPTPHPTATRPPLIVIGFAGGFIRRTSTYHGEIALALRLSKKYGTRIHSEIFENHHGEEAHREILRLLQFSDSKKPSSIALTPDTPILPSPKSSSTAIPGEPPKQ